MKIPAHCFDCTSGKYEVVEKAYTTTTQDGTSVTVPTLKLLHCTVCGSELLPPESLRKIRAAVADSSEAFTKPELYAFLDRFDLTQKDAAETIGLGEKTLHRWLKGTQVVSRSMGNYLRLLMHYPGAFGWVRRQGWRTATEITASISITSRQTDLVAKAEPIADGSKRFKALAQRDHSMVFQGKINPARGLQLATLACTER